MDEFQISILKTLVVDSATQQLVDGFQVYLQGKSGKKETSEKDFFPLDSDIGIRLKRLKKDLRDYFDANP